MSARCLNEENDMGGRVRRTAERSASEGVVEGGGPPILTAGGRGPFFFFFGDRNIQNRRKMSMGIVCMNREREIDR